MGNHPSYEDLVKKVAFLEEELSSLRTGQYNNHSLDHDLFFKICEYSKNGIALFESQDNGVTFIIKYFNQKAADIEFVNKEDVIGKKLTESFPSINKSGLLEALRSVFHHNEPEEFLVKVFSSGKLIEWKHNYIYKLSNNELVSIFIDETKNKNKDYELKEHRGKLEIAMDAADNFSFEFHFDSLKITTQKELYRSLGFKDVEINELFQKFNSLIHPEDYSNINILSQNNTENKKFRVYTEFRLKNKNDNWIWFMATGKIVDWDENKKPIKLVGLLKDIQKEKELFLKLKQSEENFLQLSENINDAFWLRSLDNKIVYANQACYKISDGFFKELFEDFNKYYHWIHPDDRERIIKQRNNNLKNPNNNYFYEHRIIRPNGEIRWYWIRTFPVYNEEGKVYRRAGISSDITEQKELVNELLLAKDKAEESDNLKSAFLANMSHEIRTPMNGILGFSELLKDEDITTKEKNEYIKIIDQNGNQLLNLINDIIDIAKIEASQLSINKSDTDINSILEETYLLFSEKQKRLKKQTINFSVNFNNNQNSTVYTDPKRLQQILNNLLSNAFKFTYSGSISFGYDFINNKNSNYFKFFVSDSGIGISSKMKKIIFERFGQEFNEKYKNSQGTGLGLAISKGIVKLLDGEIWVESTQENETLGTSGSSTFYFTIPAVDNAPQIVPIEPKITEINNFENTTILIVEDDLDNLEFLRQLLVKYEANVLLANSGEEAISIVKSNKQINLVLMDIRLPDMDGFETTRRIKKISPKLPVIAQTAYAMSNDRENCLKNGCDDYVSKPLNKSILFKKINQYIYN
ncbi:MAG: PAS domain-containing protein [Bacteroidales bacterium]|nr:PAS domain-containing protein [Bacteroidales bacterium]